MGFCIRLLTIPKGFSQKTPPRTLIQIILLFFATLYKFLSRFIFMISRRLLRIKIIQVLYAYFSTPLEDRDPVRSEKELFFSIQKTEDLYGFLLLLPLALRNLTESKIEQARNKKLPTQSDLNPNLRLVNDPFVEMLSQGAPLMALATERKLNWAPYPDLVRMIYNAMVESPEYETFMLSDLSDFEASQKFWSEFYGKIAAESAVLFESLEELSIFWNDDIEFVLSQIIKTVKQQSSGSQLQIFPLFKEEEDREYATRLFRKTLANSKEYRTLIEAHTQNWDLERIAFMDIIIMQTAIAELVEFPSIPVSVTFNEFIELAKFYSTPRSSTFVNGILDKITAGLKESGAIVKHGRGLIEK